MLVLLIDNDLEKAVDTVINGGLAEWSTQGSGGSVTGGIAAFEEHSKVLEMTEVAEHASAIIGQIVYVGYPFLHQATVVAAHHPGGTWRANKRGDLSSHPLREDEWADMSTGLLEKYLKMMAVDLGTVTMVYEVKRQQGRWKRFTPLATQPAVWPLETVSVFSVCLRCDVCLPL